MKKSRLLFFVILLFAFIIRVIFLTEYPEGFYQDEASWGYNAYSLMKTGRDEYGKFLPVVLESFGDYKMALNAYFLIPFIKIFGITEFAVRIGAVFSSLIILVLSYLIIKRLTGNRKTALLSMLILSILPWQIVFSRMGNETVTSMMFYLLSLYVFTRYYDNNRISLFIISVSALVLSILTYYSVWFPAIFTIGLYSYIFLKKRQFAFQKLLFLTFPLILIFILYKSTGSVRLKQINIIQNSGAVSLLDEQIREDQKEFPYLFTRIFHNKPMFYPHFILTNYFKTFNFNFLFFEGDNSGQIHSVPYNGVIYSVFAIFTVIGCYVFIRRYGKEISLLVFVFILVNFIGNAVSVFGSQSQRTLIASIAVSLLIAEGIIQSYRLAEKKVYSKIVAFLFLIALLVQMSGYNHQYFWHANRNKPWYRNYGARELVMTLKEFEPKFKKIIITGNSSYYIFHYFYNKTDPEIVQNESKELLDSKDALSHAYRKKIGDYLIMPIDCPVAGKIEVLYVCKGNTIPKNSRIVRAINYKDNQPAFVLIEFMKDEQNIALPNPLKYSNNFGLLSDNDENNWKEN